MQTQPQPLPLENLGSLITLKGVDPPVCLGHLVHFEGKTFDPGVGLVEVSKSDAEAHNKALDEALIKGLLETCEIGQWGTFYLTGKEGSYTITTFTGTVVSDNVLVWKTNRRNRYGGFHLRVEFKRNGRVFVGKNNGDDDLVNFKRVK